MVIALHVAYVSYVLFGQIAILLGLALHWGWVRNPWFRWTHLIAILIVAVEAVLDITCPLTTWEYNLRTLAGQQAAEGSFIGRLLRNVMFFDASPWVFTSCYLGFALLVAVTFWLAPPRRRRQAR
jgi:hypothetical protein